MAVSDGSTRDHPFGSIGSIGIVPAEALAFVPVVVLAALQFLQPAFPLDDAYITLHNARALLAGGADPNYAGASALTGATSAVHLVLVAALGAILPLELASRLVLLAALCLYAAGLNRLLRRTQCPPLVRVGLLWSALLLGYLPYQLLNGLESGLALAAIAWALVLADSRWGPILFGALPFVRPELAFLALPLFARQLWSIRAAPRDIAAAVALFAAGSVPWTLLYLATTGAPLPNTGTAKFFFFAEASQPLGERIGAALRALNGALIGPFVLGVVGLARTGPGRCGLAFLTCWLTISVVTLPGGLAHNWYRYVSMATPLLILGWAQILARPAAWRTPVAVLLTGWALVTGYHGVVRRLDDRSAIANEAMVAAVRRHVPAGDTILIHDAGYLAWAEPGRPLVDVVGLKATTAPGWREALGADSGDRADRIVRTAASSGARYFIVLAHEPFWGTLAEDLARAGWRLDPVEEGGPMGYTLFRITPPQPRSPS